MSVMAPNHFSGLPRRMVPRGFGKPLPLSTESPLVYHCYLKDGQRYICGTDLVADEALPGGTRILIVRKEDST